MTELRRCVLPILLLLLLPAGVSRYECERIAAPFALKSTDAAHLERVAAEEGDDASDSAINEVHAKKLEGMVHIDGEKNAALATVLIEECDSSWSRVLASTKTDYQGRFKLKPGRRGKTHYLRVSAKGFNTRHYEVILSSDAPEELMLTLQLASRSQAAPAIGGKKFS